MPSPEALRQRRYRERKKGATAAAPLLFERSDWQLFCDPRTLPQKAGCEPGQIGRAVLKELTDNALDSGGGEKVTVTGDAHHCHVTDNGPGIPPGELARLFSISRSLVSSKLVRLPTRGMLGNGLRVVMGAIVAFGGTITVTTRGRCYDLIPSRSDGSTEIRPGAATRDKRTIVEVSFPQPVFTDEDFAFCRSTVRLARGGSVYQGRSLPSWYSAQDLLDLLAAAPRDLPPHMAIERMFGIAIKPFKPSLKWVETFLRDHDATLDGEAIGELGELAAFEGHRPYYRRVAGSVSINGADIPFSVEAWVVALTMEKDKDWFTRTNPIINRSSALAEISTAADSTGLRLHGCGLDFKVAGAKRAIYHFELAVTTPYLRLTGDGKAPYLGDFHEAIEKAVKGAASEAYRYLVRPAASMSIVDAAVVVMKDAYMKASDNGQLPAKARQIMYAARGQILAMTELKKFSDKYFTQVLLPDYVLANPEECADWDVVFDARGHLTEPHTGERVALGTLEVRQYLGQRPRRNGRPALADGVLYSTTGPLNRYRNVLFVEKEGFDELFDVVQLAERYDLAIMSTKGMSVVAARQLLDEVAPLVDHIFVLHDLDVSGFSIFGTLYTDSRRYTFTNDVASKIADIGLRLEDVEDMGLEAETVEVQNPYARRDTLREHGATEEEIEFLAPEDEKCRRVELNAMTSRQLVDFVEAALEEHGVEKVVPDKAVLEEQARQRLQIRLTNERLAAFADDIASEAAAMALPRNLEGRVRRMLGEHPELSWDQALARIIG